MGMLEDAHLAGMNHYALKQSAKHCRNWTEFQSERQEAIAANA